MNGIDESMNHKLCVVTGGTAGIGLSTSRMLAQRGARVILTGRDQQRGQAAVAEIQRAGGAKPEFVSVDLSDQSAIRAFAARFQDSYSKLDVLVNNAGVMFGQRKLSVDGIEMTFAVNHLAYFMMANLLLPALQAAGSARIVNVASDAHTGTELNFEDLQSKRWYSGWMAYKRSKLCNLLFNYELSRRLTGTQVTANALHPGFVASDIGISNGWALGIVWKLLTRFAISPEHGAKTPVYLACSPDVDSVSGKYFFECQSKRSSPISYDLLAAKRLWDVSVSLTQCEAITVSEVP